MAIGKKAAKRLAIAYSCLNKSETVVENGIWAEMLLDAQKETGVEMHSPDLLESFIINWKRQRDRQIVEQDEAQRQLPMYLPEEKLPYKSGLPE